MFKKTLTTVFVAGALFLSGGAAANAATDYPDTGVSDNTPGIGQSITITVNINGNYNNVYFVIIGGPGADLASLVHTAAPAGGVTKPVVNGSASATFRSVNEGTHQIGIYDTEGNLLTTVALEVSADNGDFTSTAVGAANGSTGSNAAGANGLPATGGEVPLTALWIGAGALGLGGIAVVAATARRRAHSTN